MKKRSNLINYLYLIILDIRDLDQKTRILIKRIKIINIYDQIINRKYTYLKVYTRRKRAIEDINQNKIIIKKIIFISDFNVYSLKLNSTYENSIGARPLETLLTKFNLIVINEEGMPIKRSL